MVVIYAPLLKHLFSPKPVPVGGAEMIIFTFQGDIECKAFVSFHIISILLKINGVQLKITKTQRTQYLFLRKSLSLSVVQQRLCLGTGPGQNGSGFSCPFRVSKCDPANCMLTFIKNKKPQTSFSFPLYEGKGTGDV